MYCTVSFDIYGNKAIFTSFCEPFYFYAVNIFRSEKQVASVIERLRFIKQRIKNNCIDISKNIQRISFYISQYLAWK